jgi:hypothetical protein
VVKNIDHRIHNPSDVSTTPSSVLERVMRAAATGKVKNAELLTPAVLADEAYSFNLGGTFNGGTAASMTLGRILADETVHRRVRAEILAAFPPESRAPITYAAAETLPYLVSLLYSLR